MEKNDPKEQINKVDAAVRAELPVLAAELLKMSSTGSHDGGRFRELARELTGIQPEIRLDLVISMIKRASLEAAVEQVSGTESNRWAAVGWMRPVGTLHKGVPPIDEPEGWVTVGPRPEKIEQKSRFQGHITEDDVAQLIGQGYMLSGKGEKDRPLYLLDLARRIALAINRPKTADRCIELAEEVRKGG